MQIKQIIEFKNWADDLYISYCPDLSDEDLDLEIPGSSTSLRHIFYHLSEVQYYWFEFISTNQFPPRLEAKKWSNREIVGRIRFYNKKFLSKSKCL